MIIKEKTKNFIFQVKPQLVEIPKMNDFALWGKENNNEEDGTYNELIGIDYGKKEELFG